MGGQINRGRSVGDRETGVGLSSRSVGDRETGVGLSSRSVGDRDI